MGVTLLIFADYKWLKNRWNRRNRYV